MTQESFLTCDSCGRRAPFGIGAVNGWISVSTVRTSEEVKFADSVSGELCSTVCLRVWAALQSEPKVEPTVLEEKIRRRVDSLSSQGGPYL